VVVGERRGLGWVLNFQDNALRDVARRHCEDMFTQGYFFLITLPKENLI